jgi:hypothetical protein
MRGKALYEALLDAAKLKGLTVRRESMTRGTSAGGFCVIKGVPTAFVDERASIDAQIEILSGVLRRYEWGDVELPEAVRVAIVR